jgi:hypothetical protein
VAYDLAMPANLLSQGGPYKVATYIQDYTPPTLEYFTLDMDSGHLHLYFDEPVRTTPMHRVHPCHSIINIINIIIDPCHSIMIRKALQV